MRVITALTLTLVLAVRPAVAQVVTGTVLQPDGGAPLSSAIVVASDAHGVAVARALTGVRGEFRLRLPAAGRYALSVLRIGFRPTDGSTLAVAVGETVQARIVASSAAITLAAMGVRERETCRVRSDTGLMVTRVWEEARKAMLTSELTAEGTPLVAEWIVYDRVLDSTSRVVRSQHVRTSRHSTTHAFRSVSADSLRERGYVVEDSAGMNYYAPDADVLLSDDFVATHCFRLAEPSDARAGLTGVAFAPTHSRRDMREIEGTLWVDRASAELRLLEFRFINLPEAGNAARPGGVVEFRRLDDGNWLVSRWSMRMPQLGMRDRVRSDVTARARPSGGRVTFLLAVQVAGGEVTQAMHGDSVVYRGAGPSVAVQLVSRDPSMAVDGAMLTLDGTDYAATASSSGVLRIAPVLEGRYHARVRTPLMAFLGAPALERDVETRDDARVDSLELPALRHVVGNACPRDSIARGRDGMVFGRVRDQAGNAVPGAMVTSTWRTDFAGTAQSVSLTERTLSSRSDSAGYWRHCGVPLDLPLSIAVATDSGVDVHSVTLGEPAFAAMELVPHPRDARRAGVAVVRQAEASALVEIEVTDERGRPISAATLDVRSGEAPPRVVVTGASGRALLSDVPRGSVIIAVQCIGFAPGELTTTLDAPRVLLPIRLAAAAAPQLDTVRVVGVRGVRGRFDEFETRRALHQATVSITRNEIEQRNPTAIWQMLSNVPGIVVADRDNMVVATSQRTFRQNFGDEPCFLAVVVDGVMVNRDVGRSKGAGFDLRQLPAPGEIHGVEVFNGPASIPLQYGGEGHDKWCGLIAIWTR